MKKTIIFILLFLFTIALLNGYELDIIEGEGNIGAVIKSKPISVLLTMDNMLHLNEPFDIWLKQYNAKQKDKGKPELDKEKMIQDMLKDLKKGLKNSGGKWKLNLIDGKEEAKDGYMLHVNIDQIRPIPMASFTAKYSITAYKSGSDEVLFKVKLNAMLIRAGVVIIIGLPEDSFKDAGELLVDVLPGFLRKGK